MRYQRAYSLLDEPPYIPERLLALRFEAKVGPPGEGGCRIWHGAVRARGDNSAVVGQMRLKTPTGSMLVTAPRVAWFLGGGGWLGDDVYLKRTCGRGLCCAKGHLAPTARVDRRRLSVAQVLECRQLYWGQDDLPQRLKSKPQSSPVGVASRQLNITQETVQRVVQGQPVNPTTWKNWELTVEDVRRAVEDARAAIDACREGRGAVWTQQRLAARYGVELSTISNVLSGIHYQDVAGPTCEKDGRLARDTAARAEARRLRQATQGDASIRARQAQAS